MPLVFGGRVYAIFFSRILDAHLGPRPPWHQSKMHEYTGDSRILQHYDRTGSCNHIFGGHPETGPNKSLSVARLWCFLLHVTFRLFSIHTAYIQSAIRVLAAYRPVTVVVPVSIPPAYPQHIVSVHSQHSVSTVSIPSKYKQCTVGTHSAYIQLTCIIQTAFIQFTISAQLEPVFVQSAARPRTVSIQSAFVSEQAAYRHHTDSLYAACSRRVIIYSAGHLNDC